MISVVLIKIYRFFKINSICNKMFSSIIPNLLRNTLNMPKVADSYEKMKSLSHYSFTKFNKINNKFGLGRFGIGNKIKKPENENIKEEFQNEQKVNENNPPLQTAVTGAVKHLVKNTFGIFHKKPTQILLKLKDKEKATSLTNLTSDDNEQVESKVESEKNMIEEKTIDNKKDG